MSGGPQTEDEIYNEARSQLAKIMMTQEQTIAFLEREAKDVSEYPIQKLARQAGFSSTSDFLAEWFDDLIEILGGGRIRAYGTLYDTPELQHIISLQERTKLKRPKAGGRRGRGGGGRGGGRAGAFSRGDRNMPPMSSLRQPHPSVRRGPGNISFRAAPQNVPPRRSPDRASDASSSRRYPESMASSGHVREEGFRQSERTTQRVPSPRRTQAREISPDNFLSGYSPVNRIPLLSTNRQHPSDIISNERSREGVISPVQGFTSLSAAHGRTRTPPISNYGGRPTPIISSSQRRAAPPPGFEDHREPIEVSSRRYESFSPSYSAASTRNYQDVGEDDPFGVSTARIYNGDYMDAPNQNGYQEPRSNPAPTDFYDDDYVTEDAYYQDERRDRQHQNFRPPPNQVYNDRYNEPVDHFIDSRQAPRHAYGDGNYYRDQRDVSPIPRPPSVGYTGRDQRDLTPVPQPPSSNERVAPSGYNDYGHHHVSTRSRSVGYQSPMPDEEFHDAQEEIQRPEYRERQETVEPTFEMVLEPCRDGQLRGFEPLLCTNDYAVISEGLSYYQYDENLPVYYSSNPLEYFADVITDIHVAVAYRSESSFYMVLRDLDQSIILKPGYDALSIYYVVKALGKQFFTFHIDFKSDPDLVVLRIQDNRPKDEETFYKNMIKRSLKFMMPTLEIPNLSQRKLKAFLYKTGNKKFPYYVKLQSTVRDEKQLEADLRNVTTFEMVNVISRSLCIYFHNNLPYRAQIIGPLDDNKISIELVDVGVFLTVDITELKSVETDVLATKPRFAIPCVLENDNDKNLVFSRTDDGFPKLSKTNTTVPMELTPKDYYMSLKIII